MVLCTLYTEDHIWQPMRPDPWLFIVSKRAVELFGGDFAIESLFAVLRAPVCSRLVPVVNQAVELARDSATIADGRGWQGAGRDFRNQFKAIELGWQSRHSRPLATDSVLNSLLGPAGSRGCLLVV